MHKNLTFAFFFFLFSSTFAQHTRFHHQNQYEKPNSFFKNDTSLNKKRTKMVNGLYGGGFLVGAAYLIPSWYSVQDLAPFHFFDDGHEWLQQDKLGHQLGAFNASRWMINLYKWAGMPKKRAIIQGGLIGLATMCSIEVADGFGKEWGASWWDIVANTTGSGLAMLNQHFWNEERIQRKVSYMPLFPLGHKNYAKDYPNLLGSNIPERMLKDYNEIAEWYSFRIHSFLPDGKFKEHYPRWLNVAVGFGGKGMIGRYYKVGDLPGTYDSKDVIRAREYRQYYLSLDIDLSNIKTKYGMLNTLMGFSTMIRIPFPSVEMDRYGVRFLPLK
jgi:hypothetical protein